jgi:hypothetical protein
VESGGWKRELGFPGRGDSRTFENLSGVELLMISFTPCIGSIHWSRTFGASTASGAAHGAEETEQVERSFPPECRDAQQQLAVIWPPEVQQQHFCSAADSSPPCLVAFRSGTNNSPFADNKLSTSVTLKNWRSGIIMYYITNFWVGKFQ